MKRKRKNYLSDEKVVILKRHLIDKVPVSDLCDGYSLQGSRRRSSLPLAFGYMYWGTLPSFGKPIHSINR